MLNFYRIVKSAICREGLLAIPFQVRKVRTIVFSPIDEWIRGGFPYNRLINQDIPNMPMGEVFRDSINGLTLLFLRDKSGAAYEVTKKLISFAKINGYGHIETSLIGYNEQMSQKAKAKAVQEMVRAYNELCSDDPTNFELSILVAPEQTTAINKLKKLHIIDLHYWTGVKFAESEEA